MNTATQTRTRTRPVRNVDVGAVPPKPVPTEQMIRLAQLVYTENRTANAATSAANKAKEELERLMCVPEAPKEFVVQVGDAIVDVSYGPGQADYIDIATLKGLVDGATLEKIMQHLVHSARGGKGAVEEHAGKSICVQATRVKTTEPGVKLKQRKDPK